MTLIDRVAARIETDIDTGELQLLIDEALAEMIQRHGPNADPANPITVTLHGRTRTLTIVRPIEIAEAIVVVEHIDYGWYTSDSQTTTLAADDYRIWHGGRTLERLRTGTHHRSFFGDRIDVTYTPVNDGDQRQEVVIKMVKLAVEYEGNKSRKVGDVETTFADYVSERERALASLAPRKGLLFA